MAHSLDTPFSRVLLDGSAGVVVSPASLQSIIEEQLVQGGTLDTIALETGLLNETEAQRALSLAWGCAPVDVAAIESPDPAAVSLLPQRIATALGTAPFSVDADAAVHVVCKGPLDQGLIDEVAALIGRKVVAHVVPEVRVWQGLHRAYGIPIEERFLALLRQLSPDLPDAADAADAPPAPDRPDPSARPKGVVTQQRSATVDDNAIVTWDLFEALAHLAAEDSRDGIAHVATQFARKFLPFAAVFGLRVRAESCECIGWQRQGSACDALFSATPYVVANDCLVHRFFEEPAPFLGAPPLSQGNATFLAWLGRPRPQTLLLVPVVVARRPVAALCADGGNRLVDPQELAALLAFSARLGPAFEALLRQRHRLPPSLLPRPVSAPAIDSQSPTDVLRLPPPIPEDNADNDDNDDNDDHDDNDEGSTPPSPPSPQHTVCTPTDAIRPTLPLAASDASDEGVALGSRRLLPQTAPVDAPPARRSILPLSVMIPKLKPMTAPLPEATTSAMTSPLLVPVPADAAALQGEHSAFDPGPFDHSPFESGPFDNRDGGPPNFSKPPQAAANTNTDGQTTPAVLAPRSPSLPDGGLPERLPTAGKTDRDPNSTLFAVDDTEAPAAWQGVLTSLVEQGLQGGTVSDASPQARGSNDWDDSGWEQVVYDPVHAKELDSGPHHPQGTRAAEPSHLTFSELSMSILGDSYALTDDDLSEASKGAASEPSAGGDPPLSALTPKELVGLLFGDDDERVAHATHELLARGPVCVAALGEGFPGRLRADPFDPLSQVRSARDLGAVVDVLARLGLDGLDAAIPHLDSAHPAHRFGAVLLFSLHPDPRAIGLLRSRLHDPEPRIADLAVTALLPFTSDPRLEPLLGQLRESTSTSLNPYPLKTRRRAVELLGQLHDVHAVPLLVALLSEELGSTAHQALRTLTRHDYGFRPNGWEKWWAKAKKRSRVEWLIDALSCADLGLRTEAHRELKAAAGDDFGYRPDSDKRSRRRSLEAWQQWKRKVKAGS